VNSWRPDLTGIRLNSYACGLPAHHRNVARLLEYIHYLEAQVEDLGAKLQEKEQNTDGN
jgi:hypothetical protein